MSRLESGSTSPAFSLLVKRLQESLSRMEQFDVEMAAQTAYDGECLVGRRCIILSLIRRWLIPDSR